MPRFRIHHLIAWEFTEVYAWYSGHSPLAAENFDQAFFAALERVQQTPSAHALWRRTLRRIRLKRYPYILIYHTDRSHTSVLALAHDRREPTRLLTTTTQRLAAFE